MRFARAFVSLLLIAGPALYAAAGPSPLVRVPQEAPTLDAAIDRVADGGVIEMAAGTYATPGNGFSFGNKRKAFTVRAAAGAAVAFDGGGSHALVRLVNSDRARGKRITFEGITFQNGFSIESNQSGGVTLAKAEALFRNCSFVNNRAAGPSTGGGAVKALEGSSATFVNSSFRGNSSPNRGGAISVRSAEVTVQGGEFVGNRTNLPGHQINAFGGAIMVLDGTLRVSDVRFEGNEAAWVGGAIYAIGTWDRGSDVLVIRSSFIGNQAVADPCCVNPQSFGGALHAEDLTRVRIQQSLFLRNRAEVGGAVDIYRADVEIHGSVLRGNWTKPAGPDGGAGGAIAALSADFADSSTDFGAVNRRASRLVVTQSLIQGGSEIARVPNIGGCIVAGGDGLRMYGGGAVAPAGTLEENRARVEVRGAVFFDCDVEAGANGGGLGGAIDGDLIDLTVEDSMFLDSDARGLNGSGGGISLRQESSARIVRTTFARNSAQSLGGALHVNGSAVQVDDCRFYGNGVVPGTFAAESNGTAIFSIPFLDGGRSRNVEGVISNSTFSENPGLPVLELDSTNGAVNALRYDGNRFSSTLFGDRVYLNPLADANGLSVPALNGLTVYHGGLGATRKSQVPNSQVFAPREGSLRIVPSPNSVGAGAPAPTASLLAYAWSGGSAQIGTLPLPQKAGLLEVAPGRYTLAVDGAAAAQADVSGSCTAGPVLCLNGNRFRAEVTWKAGGAPAQAQAVALSGDTGYFWFLDPSNIELVVKVLDGRALNGHFWVFYGALSNLEYTLTLTDTVTGNVKTYTNPSGRFASAGDTTAFPAPQSAGLALSEEEASASESFPVLAAACVSGGTSLCLNGSRFRVELSWKDFNNRTGAGQAVPLTSDTGYFWFTSPSNVEVVLKVLDARPVNGHFWVFFGALSNVEYTITVTDTVTGAKKTYFNPLGKFGSQGDTVALPGG
jgi:predicted outer membrane repeat protein